MRFVLEVDLDAGAVKDATADELGRILRYWGSNMKHLPLALGDSQALYDSTYTEVGSWTVTS
jgi:hypothetical protein